MGDYIEQRKRISLVLCIFFVAFLLGSAGGSTIDTQTMEDSPAAAYLVQGGRWTISSPP